MTAFALGWRPLVTPALALLSIAIAVLAMLTTRKVARQRATLDLIEKRESTPYYREIAAAFSRIRRGDEFGRLSNPAEADRADRLAVTDYLNHYELISIGIRSGFLDAKVYRAWMLGPFVRDWNAAAGWVQRERWKRGTSGSWTYNPRVFANYQALACRWSRDAVRLDEAWGGPPRDAEAGGPGDEVLPA